MAHAQWKERSGRRLQLSVSLAQSSAQGSLTTLEYLPRGQQGPTGLQGPGFVSPFQSVPSAAELYPENWMHSKVEQVRNPFALIGDWNPKYLTLPENFLDAEGAENTPKAVFPGTATANGAVPTIAVTSETKGVTTMMIRNIPSMYTQSMMLEEFSLRGLLKYVDFFYLPLDSRFKCNVGYCFVNLTSESVVDTFFKEFTDAKLGQVRSKKRSQIIPSKIQGLAANIETYRNCGVMRLPATSRPIILRDGVSVPFPPPNKGRWQVEREKVSVSKRETTGHLYHSALDRITKARIVRTI